MNKLLSEARANFRNDLSAEKEKHRRELEELNNWYLKTLKEREDEFLAKLKNWEFKYQTEVDRHARVLQDALDQARRERDEADKRLDGEKRLNRDNLQQ